MRSSVLIQGTCYRKTGQSYKVDGRNIEITAGKFLLTKYDNFSIQETLSSNGAESFGSEVHVSYRVVLTIRQGV